MAETRASQGTIPHDLEAARLAMTGPPPPRAKGDWRKMVGMFADDPIVDAITEAGRRVREAERESA